MKNIIFNLEGTIRVPDNVTLEDVKNALGYNTGANRLYKGNPVQLKQQDLPPNISYKFVKVREQGKELRYETDNATAKELASKLISASSNGDFPVINSLCMPVPAGDAFNYVVYHKGDDYFELE